MMVAGIEPLIGVLTSSRHPRKRAIWLSYDSGASEYGGYRAVPRRSLRNLSGFEMGAGRTGARGQATFDQTEAVVRSEYGESKLIAYISETGNRGPVNLVTFV